MDVLQEHQRMDMLVRRRLKRERNFETPGMLLGPVHPDWCFVPLYSAGRVLSVGDVESGSLRREKTYFFCGAPLRQWNKGISTAHYRKKGTKEANKVRKMNLNSAKQEIRRKPMDYNNIEDKGIYTGGSHSIGNRVSTSLTGQNLIITATTHPLQSQGRPPGTPMKRHVLATAPEEEMGLRNTGSAVTPAPTGVLPPFPQPVVFCL
ncbi:hypothetical protein CHS0354_006459 [Potamilus streckersoni]|uniref:Uncharacterized protein n=1 Tax=Potamilus streckersoni TaxID=2493646 RepID=A0AAE0T9G2_9BIVA|nr:hypothetical protein CHS0354_006459 [Potamilus streckersoni]